MMTDCTNPMCLILNRTTIAMQVWNLMAMQHGECYASWNFLVASGMSYRFHVWNDVVNFQCVNFRPRAYVDSRERHLTNWNHSIYPNRNYVCYYAMMMSLAYVYNNDVIWFC